MALIFIDSCGDHYNTAQIPRKWTTAGGSIVTGSRTGNGMRGVNANFPSKTFNAEYSTMTMGLAHKTDAFANPVFGFNNVSNGSLDFRHVGDGRLRMGWGITGQGTILSPATAWIMNTLTWYYFELKGEIVATSPPHLIASLRVNGVEILAWDYTHPASAVGPFNRIFMSGPGGGTSAYIDDLYVTDGEFLGDVRIGVLYPNAAGDSAGWSPTGAATNWEATDEHPADDDTSYVSAATVGLKDLYNLDDIDPAFTGAIKGVQALWLVKKSDEGAGAVKGVWKSGATEITQASGHNYLAPDGFHPSAVDYTYNIQTERESLFTASDWVTSEINGLQLGLTRTL